MNTLTKAQFISEIAEKSEMSKADISKVIDAIEAVTVENVTSGSAVPVPGVGKVFARDVAERQMRNPQTGESFTKPAHKAPKVSIGKSLKDAVNS